MSSRSLPLALPLVVLAVAVPLVVRLADRHPATAGAAPVATSAPRRPAATGTVVLTSVPVASAAATTAAVATSVTTVPRTAPTVTTVGAVVAPAVRVRVDAEVPALGGAADAWRLAPRADGRSRLAAVLAALAPTATIAPGPAGTGLAGTGLAPGESFTATASATTWRYAAPVLDRPIPDRCVGLDLSDPRAFPRCQAALADAKVAWRGGDQAMARATALWTRMGYDLAAFAAPAGPDGDGYVTARLLLGGEPGPYALRVRFQGDGIEAAEGVLATPTAVSDQRTPTVVPLGDLASRGPTEVRAADGTVLDPSGFPREATIVGAEPTLVAVAAPAGDDDLYAVPGYAFVAADGYRYLRPASLVPPWLLPPA